MRTTTENATTANDAERQAVMTAERKLNRAHERLAESEAMLRRKQDDADISGIRVSVEELAQRQEMVTNDGLLIAKLEQELDAAKAAPARRVERERLASDLQTQAVAIDREIDAAITVLEAALSKGTVLADAIGRAFLDPNLGYRVLTGPFRGSSIISRLRFWRNDISAQRIALYRADRARLERAS